MNFALGVVRRVRGRDVRFHFDYADVVGPPGYDHGQHVSEVCRY